MPQASSSCVYTQLREQFSAPTEIRRFRIRRGAEMAEDESSNASAAGALIELAIDSWKFARLFTRVISKLDAGEQARYANQMRFFQKRIDSAAEVAGARIVTIEGQPFEPGMAASPLNLEDFQDGDTLFVDQMLEPIVMGNEGVLRTGTMMLRKL